MLSFAWVTVILSLGLVASAWFAAPREARRRDVSADAPPSMQVPSSRGAKESKDYAPLARFALDVAENDATGMRLRMIYRRDRSLRGSDHIPFLRQGWPAGRLTEPNEDYHHQHQNVRMVDGVQYGDLPQFVDFHYVGKVARLNGTTMASLATAPPPPTAVKIVVSKLDNNSTLEWKNGPGAPKDTRYIVVWRPTSSPNWTREIPASQLAHVHHGAYQKNADGSYTVTLPISKDNAIFGVESVGAHGQRSAAVVPMPTR